MCKCKFILLDLMVEISLKSKHVFGPPLSTNPTQSASASHRASHSQEVAVYPCGGDVLATPASTSEFKYGTYCRLQGTVGGCGGAAGGGRRGI